MPSGSNRKITRYWNLTWLADGWVRGELWSTVLWPTLCSAKVRRASNSKRTRQCRNVAVYARWTGVVFETPLCTQHWKKQQIERRKVGGQQAGRKASSVPGQAQAQQGGGDS